MKKLSSMLLACAMLLTVFCAVPVQAKPYNEYPYVYEDLEGAVDGFYFVRNNATCDVNGIISDPTGRSGKVWGVSVPKTTATNPTNIQFRQENISVPVKMDTTTNTSLKYYMETGTPGYKKYAVTYTFAGTAAEDESDTVSGWYQSHHEFTWQTKNWTTLSDTVTWSKSTNYNISGLESGNTLDYGSLVITKIEYSFYNSGTLINESTLLDGASHLTFYFDELIHEPVADTAIDEVEYGKNLFTYGDFENNATTGFYANNDGGANKFVGTVKTGATPMDGENGKYLNIANPDGTYVWNQLEYIGDSNANVRYLPNRMYEFTFWYRVNELYDNGFNYGYDDGQVKTDRADVWIKWGIGNGTGASEKLDLHGLYASGNWPVDKYAQEDVLILDGEWHKASINFSFDAKTFAEPLFRGAPFRATIVFQAGTQWTHMHMDMDLDNIQMIDKGPITNGDFEQGTGYFNRWYNAMATGATDTSTTQPVYGWFAQDGATVAQSDDVRANAASGSTKSLQVNIAANNTGAKVMQPLSLLPTTDGKYKLSFWAKDASLADGEAKPIAVVLDREQKAAAKNQANEVYNVPDYEFHTGTNEKVSGGWVYNTSVMETQSWKLTNEWQYFETYIDNTFPVLAGKEGASTANILPRQPFMYFLYNFGDTNARSFLLDDVALEGLPAQVPAVSNVVVNGVVNPGKTVSVSYDFTNPLGVADANTLVRVKANGVSLGSFKGMDGTFIIPETAIGKTLTFEVLPIDAEGNVGEVVAVSAAPTADWAKLYIDEGLTSARVYAGENKTGVVIFAAYDNDNMLTDIEIVDVNLAANTKADAITTEFSLTDAKTVKVMFWKDIDDVEPISVAEMATVK